MNKLNKIVLQIGILLLLAETHGQSQTTLSVILRTNNPITIPAGETWELLSAESSTIGTRYVANTQFLVSPTLVVSCQDSEIYYPTAPTEGSEKNFINFSTSTWVWSGNDGSLPVTGPATLSVRTYDNFVPVVLLTYKKINLESSLIKSSTAIVVPSNATGDVDVKMEQSSDNVTWTECLPGTYNSSTVKRFFRLRAVEK